MPSSSYKSAVESLKKGSSEIPNIEPGKFVVGQLAVFSSKAAGLYSEMPEGQLAGLVVGYLPVDQTSNYFPELLPYWHKKASKLVAVLVSDMPGGVIDLMPRVHGGPLPPHLAALGSIHYVEETALRQPQSIGMCIRKSLGLHLQSGGSNYRLEEATTALKPLNTKPAIKWTYVNGHSTSESNGVLDYWTDGISSNLSLVFCFNNEVVFELPPIGLPKGEDRETLPALKERDLVIISDEGKIGGMGASRHLLHGVPATCMTAFSGRPSVTGTIVIMGGRMSNRQLTVPRCALSPVPDPWFMPEDKVEVIASVVFKKRQLVGQRGKIVAYPDQDGDAGVEFNLNLEAGSLDGLGKDGHCLFVPAKALKKL